MENGLAPSRHRTNARILVLELGPATTAILVTVAVAVPEAEEAEYARAQRRGLVRGSARVSSTRGRRWVTIWGVTGARTLVTAGTAVVTVTMMAMGTVGLTGPAVTAASPRINRGGNVVCRTT